MPSRSRMTFRSETETLILSNSTDATSDYLCNRLAEAKVPHRRFDTDLPLDTVHVRISDRAQEIAWSGRTLRPEQVHAIVYRRPKPFAPPVEGDAHQQNHAADEWAEAIEGFLAHIPAAKWINHPASNFAASHKIHQLKRAHDSGLITPKWIVTTIPAEAQQFLNENGPELVVKPLASGYIERTKPADDTLIYTQAIDKSYAYLFDRVPACPVLFQSRIHKQVDVRLIVVDHNMVAVALEAKEPDGNQRLDIRREEMRDVSYSPLEVPQGVASGVCDLMTAYRLRFAAFDFAIDVAGRWVFFEINPNGQWAWLDLARASDIGQIFIKALRSPAEAV